MTLRDDSVQAAAAWSNFWRARNKRERSFLLAAIFVCLLGATYALLIEPALTQRAALQKSLPLLRQQTVQMHQLAQQAKQLPAAPQSASDEFTRDTLEISLKSLGLVAEKINVSDRSAQLEFASAPLASLLTWLELAQTQGLSVTETDMQVLTNADRVKATVTLTKQ